MTASDSHPAFRFIHKLKFASALLRLFRCNSAIGVLQCSREP
ncbi:hypothetical protein Ga0080559_TMP1829 [Salipiger profundus]|uniref:Uncharacterized protein n=1 Tax=Salipiger profundus TaxID=1229727 RepID=A0A1U7D3H6_9RHOB|nr:hypothetical protein Ga0080559_TMP1829 [Salipiger profundus]